MQQPVCRAASACMPGLRSGMPLPGRHSRQDAPEPGNMQLAAIAAAVHAAKDCGACCVVSRSSAKPDGQYQLGGAGGGHRHCKGEGRSVIPARSGICLTELATNTDAGSCILMLSHLRWAPQVTPAECRGGGKLSGGRGCLHVPASSTAECRGRGRLASGRGCLHVPAPSTADWATQQRLMLTRALGWLFCTALTQCMLGVASWSRAWPSLPRSPTA